MTLEYSQSKTHIFQQFNSNLSVAKIIRIRENLKQQVTGLPSLKCNFGKSHSYIRVTKNIPDDRKRTLFKNNIKYN